MQYVIVENRSIVLLGPITWKPRLIQSEFDDLEIPFKVPPVEQGYINVDQSIGEDSSTGIEIFPIVEASAPPIDPIYQQYAGPFYTYSETEATLTYEVLDLPLHQVQNNLISIAADVRYKKEIAGATLVINGSKVSLTTDRSLKRQYTDLLNSIGDSTVNWKFAEGFIQITRDIAQQMVSAVASHVQAQFDWELNILTQIKSATDVEQLKMLEILPPIEESIPQRPVII